MITPPELGPFERGRITVKTCVRVRAVIWRDSVYQTTWGVTFDRGSKMKTVAGRVSSSNDRENKWTQGFVLHGQWSEH